LGRKFEIDRLYVLGLVLGEDKVEALATGDQVSSQLEAGDIGQSYRRRLQQCDRRRHLRQYGFLATVALVNFHLPADTLRASEESSNRFGIVERTQAVAVFCSHAPARNCQSRGETLHSVERSLVKLGPMLRDALQKRGHLANVWRGLSAVAIQQKLKDLLKMSERYDVGKGLDALRRKTAINERRRRDAELVFARLYGCGARRAHGPIIGKVNTR